MNRFLQHLSELAGRHPFDDQFIAAVSDRVRKRCAQVPVHVHKRPQAELRIEEAAREAIVEVFLEEFPDALFPIKVKRDWPRADCIIADDEAVIRFSFSPETDALMGGVFIEPVRIVVKRAPPNVFNRAARAILRRAEKPMELKTPAPPAAPAAKKGHSRILESGRK
jgi:hypothetical protein